MSLILDALNRADQERSVENHTPSLQSAHFNHNSLQPAWRRWIIEGLIIAVVAMGIYIYSQNDRQQDTGPAPNRPAMPQEIQTTTAVKATPAPAAVTVQAPIANLVKAAIPAPPISAAPDHKPAGSAAIHSLYQQGSSAQTPSNDIAATRPTPAKVKPTPADTTQIILASIPLLSQHSLRFQRSIPNIEYSVHAYADGGGFVMLNGKKYQVGNELQARLRVIAILPDSLVLDYQGRQFRLMALNSWINI